MRIRAASAIILIGLFMALALSGCCPEPCKNCPPVEKEMGITIELVKDCTVDPTDVHLSRSPDNANHVRWHNQTSTQQTVRINEAYWPFAEAQEDIVIEAGKYSPWYTMSEAGETSVPFTYKVDPLLSPSCPPGEPGITAEP